MGTDFNIETYADPVGYDLESGVYDPEGSVLLALAKGVDGRILELGCGTGRVTIPLAERGIALTALDVLPHLVEHARSKAEGLPIEWGCQDARTLQLDGQFDLIFTKGGVLNHLLTRPDQEAMLASVRQHLSPEGKFIFDVGFKRPGKMVNVPEEAEWYTFTDDKGREITVSGTDRYDYIQQLWYQSWTQSWEENGRTHRTKPTNLTLRYFMPQEMEALLHYNGFKVLERYGDWLGNPLTEESYEQICLCTRDNDE